MPRLSLYRPNRTNDYQFFDRTIKEMFTVGGLDIFIHKYLGPIVDQSPNPGNNDATLPVYNSTNPLFIEDLLLLENRDRAYDPDVFVMRGVYRTQDMDFVWTQKSWHIKTRYGPNSAREEDHTESAHISNAYRLN